MRLSKKKTKVTWEGKCPKCNSYLEKVAVMGSVLVSKCKKCNLKYYVESPYRTGVEKI